MAFLPNKLIAQVAFKAGGDIFHEIVAHNPKQLATSHPNKIQACDLHEGEFGTKGSVVEWKFILDGKPQTMKQITEDVDNEKKLLATKVLEGDALELYKSMNVSVHVETKGEVDFITWTLDYELINADNPHPLSFLNYLIECTKELESHLLG